jgi:hypothetical protein
MSNTPVRDLSRRDFVRATTAGLATVAGGAPRLRETIP